MNGSVKMVPIHRNTVYSSPHRRRRWSVVGRSLIGRSLWGHCGVTHCWSFIHSFIVGSLTYLASSCLVCLSICRCWCGRWCRSLVWLVSSMSLVVGVVGVVGRWCWLVSLVWLVWLVPFVGVVRRCGWCVVRWCRCRWCGKVINTSLRPFVFSFVVLCRDPSTKYFCVSV